MLITCTAFDKQNMSQLITVGVEALSFTVQSPLRKGLPLTVFKKHSSWTAPRGKPVCHPQLLSPGHGPPECQPVAEKKRELALSISSQPRLHQQATLSSIVPRVSQPRAHSLSAWRLSLHPRGQNDIKEKGLPPLPSRPEGSTCAYSSFPALVPRDASSTDQGLGVSLYATSILLPLRACALHLHPGSY